MFVNYRCWCRSLHCLHSFFPTAFRLWHPSFLKREVWVPVISFCLASISFQLKKPQRSRSWRPKRHAATQQQQQFCSAALHAFVFFYFSNFALRWQENESKAKKEERQRDSEKAMGKDKAIKQVWKTQTPTRNWWELWDYIERGIKWNAYRIPLGERTCYCLAWLFMSLSAVVGCG